MSDKRAISDSERVDMLVRAMRRIRSEAATIGYDAGNDAIVRIVDEVMEQITPSGQSGKLICDGCRVLGDWEHRCHGEESVVNGEFTNKPCECESCT